MTNSEAITFSTLYHELSQIDNEDPEFLMQLLGEAGNLCLSVAKPLTVENLLIKAKKIAIEEFDDFYRNHYHLLLSLLEPGFEVLRWMPKNIPGLDIETSLSRLNDYVEPSPSLGFSIIGWERAVELIEAVPDLADELKQKTVKPAMTLLDFGDERKFVAVILDEDSPKVLKNSLGEDEGKIARKVSGIVGPEVISTGDGWIVEKFLDELSPEQFLDHPDLVGTALGIALLKTHSLGISYNDRFDRGHVKLNPKTKKVSLIDWSSAREDGSTQVDIEHAVHQIRTWYKTAPEQQQTALKSFAKGYKAKI